MAACANGHNFEDGFSFCPHCGALATTGTARQGGQTEYPGHAAEPASGTEDTPESPARAPVATLVAGTSRPQQPFAQNRLALLAVAAVVIAVLVGGGIWMAVGHSIHTIKGDLALLDTSGFDNSGLLGCAGQGGYDDISAGTSVTVSDGSGRVIATGELDPGKNKPALNECDFTFTVNNVPDEDFYKVEVSHRGGLTFSHQDMVDNGWYVSASLGDNSSF